MYKIKTGHCPKCHTEHECLSYCGGTYRFYCEECQLSYYGEVVFKTSFKPTEASFIGNDELHQRYGAVLSPLS